MPIQEIQDAGAANAPMYKEEDGKRYMRVYSAGAWTAKTPGKINYNGDGNDPALVAFADGSAFYQTVVCPEVGIAAGAWGWAVLEGLVTDVVTPSLTVTQGHGAAIKDGAIIDRGADPTYLGAGDFGVFAETPGAAATAIDIYFLGLRERLQEES